MNKEVILENEFVEVAYIHDYKMAVVAWKNFVTITTEEYQRVFNEILDFTKSIGVVNFISDSRLGGVVSPEDRKWFQENAVPRAAENGLKRAALVIKKDVFKKYYMNAILKVINRKENYETRIFYNYDEAFNWLISFNDYQ